MPHLPYVGNGPYCYSNSFAMMLGSDAPSTALIEVATGSPWGLQLIGGTTPFFNSYGWNPEIGFDRALAAIGWQSTTTSSADADEALARLTEAVRRGPAWVGPLEMGYLRHQPEMPGPIGADHYVVVLDVDDERVLMHDPHGYPYVEMPVGDFRESWRGEMLGYGTPFTMRTGFTRIADVTDAEAVAAIVPDAIGWLSPDRPDADIPPGTIGNAEAATRLAEMIENEPGSVRDHLIYFAIRVGARRLSDAAACLALVGHAEASEIAATQSRLVGSMQRPLVMGDPGAAARALRELAPTYDALRSALVAASVVGAAAS
jgi:hypothetical protein